MSKFTDAELKKWDQKGQIPAKAATLESTLHFCPDWDFMIIDKTDPEFKVCTCPIDLEYI